MAWRVTLSATTNQRMFTESVDISVRNFLGHVRVDILPRAKAREFP